MTDEQRELMRIAAANLLAHQASGRKCDPHAIKWAQWTLDHIKPLGRPVGPGGAIENSERKAA